MKVSQIKIVFENGEVMTIHMKDIKSFTMSGVQQKLLKTTSDKISSFNTCKYCQIKVDNDANEYINESGGLYEPLGLQRLLEHNDITALELWNDFEVVKIIYPKWEGDDYSNSLQKVEKYEDGIEVTIGVESN